MTSLASPLPEVRSESHILLPFKLAITLALAALADWLFYMHRVGLSMALFAVVLFAASWLGNLAGLDRRRLGTAAIVLIVGLIPAVEELNALSLLFLVAGLGFSVSIQTNLDAKRLFLDRFGAFRDLFLIGPFRLTGDVVRMLSVLDFTGGFAKWFVPVIFGAIFVFLFASANPLIEKSLELLDLKESLSHIDLSRALFWALVLSMVWPFVHVRWACRKQRAPASEPVADNSEPASDFPGIFSADAILRSLILFNVLFAVQTLLDVIYLWGNATLPDGISYADYAHRGAYPLIVTALLAAGFVLAAMRPSGAAAKSAIIRPLVYLWVGQNVLLVVSSMLRLYRYVEIYMLTGWRVAALVWMLLVVIGLVLIVARIVLGQSNGWLVRMNLISLTATLYLCSLINFAAITADYNVSHSKEAAGKGVNLDTNYLYELGPQALPALGRARLLPMVTIRDCGRNRLLATQAADMASWRSWGFRSWRLQRWLDKHPDQPSSAG
jgi:Domain of unknown function (DUF4153)